MQTTSIIVNLVQQAPLIGLIALIPVLYMRYETTKLRSDFRIEITSLRTEMRSNFKDLRKELQTLRHSFTTFANALTEFLTAKDIITKSEEAQLKALIKTMIPPAMSKYYTEEVRKKLIQLLEKNTEDYTWKT